MQNRAIKKIKSIAVAVAFLLAIQLCASASTAKITIESLAQDPFLAQVLYSVPSRIASNIGEDGAVGVNRQIGSGQQMFIEEQRYGGDLVQAGLAAGNDSLVKQGLQVIEWGFKQQVEDGSFPTTGDSFHSVSMFVEGTARAFLSLNEAGQYTGQVSAMQPRLIAAARWLEQPEVERQGNKNDAPYTHRRWLLAAALGQTAELAHDSNMAVRSLLYAEDGLSLQLENGVNPEKGGYDVSYQAVSVLYGARFFVVCLDHDLQERVKKMIQYATDWELDRIDDNGEVGTAHSTRIEIEKSRSGKIKHLNTKELLQALSFATTITGYKQYREKATLVARANNWY